MPLCRPELLQWEFERTQSIWSDFWKILQLNNILRKEDDRSNTPNTPLPPQGMGKVPFSTGEDDGEDEDRWVDGGPSDWSSGGCICRFWGTSFAVSVAHEGLPITTRRGPVREVVFFLFPSTFPFTGRSTSRSQAALQGHALSLMDRLEGVMIAFKTNKIHPRINWIGTLSGFFIYTYITSFRDHPSRAMWQCYFGGRRIDVSKTKRQLR